MNNWMKRALIYFMYSYCVYTHIYMYRSLLVFSCRVLLYDLLFPSDRPADNIIHRGKNLNNFVNHWSISDNGLWPLRSLRIIDLPLYLLNWSSRLLWLWSPRLTGPLSDSGFTSGIGKSCGEQRQRRQEERTHKPQWGTREPRAEVLSLWSNYGTMVLRTLNELMKTYLEVFS